MPVVDRLARRESSWRELERLLASFHGPRSARPGAAQLLRLGELYRAACADLMQAEASDLPRETVAYLHSLVGRAHNLIYRGRGFRLADAIHAVLAEAPRRLRADTALKISAMAFYGVFLAFGLLAAGRPEFAEQVVGREQLGMMESMYSAPVAESSGTGSRDASAMAGFYIQHNTSIGLQCYAMGITLGLGTLYVLISNAISLGAVFGHMAVAPQAGNFYEFVTAHAPFELTAIVFSGAAGLRLGYGLIETRGRTRLESLRHAAQQSLPTVGAAVVLFFLAALLEGYVSGSALPYSTKAGISLASLGILAAYMAFGGREHARVTSPRAGRAA